MMSFRGKKSVRRQVVAESFLYTDLQIGTKKLRIQFFLFETLCNRTDMGDI